MKTNLNFKEEWNIYLQKKEKGTEKSIVITSAYKLTDEELVLIRKTFSIPPNFKIINIIDNKILGGLVIKFDSKVIDLSIDGQLKKFKKLMSD